MILIRNKVDSLLKSDVQFSLEALLVQLVERRSPEPDIEGSSPSGRVIVFLILFLFNKIFLYLTKPDI